MSQQTFDLTGPINLDLRVGYGSVTVHAAEGASRAVVTLAAIASDSDVVDRTIVEMRGPTLAVIGPRPRGGLFDVPLFARRFRDHDRMDVDVVVPGGTAMKISTFGADLTITGRTGGADLASGSATVNVEEIDGDLRLRYGSGPTNVQRITGAAEVKYGSGKLSLDEVGGAIDVACGSGSLHVGVAHGTVRLRSGSGGATIGVAEDDVEITSGSGDLSIGLRPGHSARLDVITGSGRLDSELFVEDAPPVGKSTATIRARTGSGDVRLHRAAEAQPA